MFTSAGSRSSARAGGASVGTARNGKGKPRGRIIPLAAGIIPLWGCQAAALRGVRVGRPSPSPLEVQTSHDAKALKGLLAAIWSSGFFRQNAVVREEFLNNEYALFDRTSPLAADHEAGLACYSPGRGRRDTIFLREDVLARVRLSMEDVSERPYAKEKILAVLVRELCHDLWNNVLDDRERAFFAMEGEDFLTTFLQAKTEEERRFFLHLAGPDDSTPGKFESFSGLAEFISTYPPDRRCGPELFAWLGERAFSKKTAIPSPFKKYYAGIFAGDSRIAEKAIDKRKLSVS